MATPPARSIPVRELPPSNEDILNAIKNVAAANDHHNFEFRVLHDELWSLRNKTHSVREDTRMLLSKTHDVTEMVLSLQQQLDQHKKDNNRLHCIVSTQMLMLCMMVGALAFFFLK